MDVFDLFFGVAMLFIIYSLLTGIKERDGRGMRGFIARNRFIISLILATLLTVSVYRVAIIWSDADYKERRMTDRGYTSDPNYDPTFDERGEYHNNGNGRRQIQYQGSREQHRDLEDINRYMRDHPGF